MEDSERKNIETFLNQKESDELFKIWNQRNLEEWREEAFDVMEQILIARTGNKPVYIKKRDIDKPSNMDVIHNEDEQPVFYNPNEVESLRKWFFKASIAVIAISLFISLVNVSSTYSMVYSWFYPIESVEIKILEVVIVGLIVVANLAFNFVIYYLPLKGFGVILNILKQMEFNSRKR